MKIVFFGASVTQQSSNQDNQLTGYVPNTIKCLKNLLPTNNLEYKQMGYGSCSFNDAGLIYFSEVVEEKPDIVIMDWHTTWLSKFDDSSYRFVIESILSTNAKVLCLLLPFKRLQKLPERDNVKQARYYQNSEANFSILDLTTLLLENDELDKCLRDEVHTTIYGGVRYGELIAKEIHQLILGENSSFCHGDQLMPSEPYLQPVVSKFPINNFTLSSENKLLIQVETLKNSGNLRVYSTQRVGPFSSSIDSQLNGTKYNQIVWDQWCHYERTTLKAITPRLSFERAGLKYLDIHLKLSKFLPEEDIPIQHADLFSSTPKKAVFNDYLYCIGANIRTVN